MYRSTSSPSVWLRPAAWLLLLAAMLPRAVGAEAPSEDATATVRAALQQATAVSSTEQTREQQLEGLRALARRLVDTRAMGQRAIGGAFTGATAAQQEEFLRLFDELIVRAYLQKLLLFRDPKFQFKPEQRHGDAVMVFSEVVMGKDAYQVNYEMRREGQGWLATDIVVEGVSLSSNYADQFSSLLKTRPFDELLDLMRRKVEHFRAPAAK